MPLMCPSCAGGGVAIRLELLALSNNRLTAAIPEGLGHMTALQKLILSHNELTGSLPDSLGCLTGLTELAVNNNRLTGTPLLVVHRLAAAAGILGPRPS